MLGTIHGGSSTLTLGGGGTSAWAPCCLSPRFSSSSLWMSSLATSSSPVTLATVASSSWIGKKSHVLGTGVRYVLQYCKFLEWTLSVLLLAIKLNQNVLLWGQLTYNSKHFSWQLISDSFLCSIWGLNCPTWAWFLKFTLGESYVELDLSYFHQVYLTFR